MSGAAPWSVKGIEPRAREVAKDLARRSGMTLGEWLNQMIMEGDEEDGYVPLSRRAHAAESYDRRTRRRRLDDVYAREDEQLDRALAAVEALTERMEAAERRSTLAISGVDQAVSGLVRRLENAEQAHAAQGRRIDDIAEELREGHKRLRRFEQDTGPRHAEALGKIEGALGKLAGQFYEAETRGRDTMTALRDRMDRFERDSSPERMAEAVVARVAARLDEAQTRTAHALRHLEGSFGQLDQRLRGVEQRAGAAAETGRLEQLAETLTRKVEESRAEMLQRFDSAARDGHIDKLERAVGDLAAHVQASERRSAQAVEAMGKEVLRIAEHLNRRVQSAEQGQARALQAVETLGKDLTRSLEAEVGKVADAIEQRLRRADEAHATGLERLGGEIARISERLSERIAQNERRSAEGVEALSERLGRVSDKMESRYERASAELAERMRLSEERTARLLEEARESVDRQLQARREPAGQGWADDFPGAAAEADWRDPGAAPFPAADPEAALDQALDVFEPAPAPAPAPAAATVFGAPAAEAAPPSPTFEAPAPQAPAFQPQAFAAAPAAADELEDFSAETEFVGGPTPQGERLSTREAIAAARAATRLGAGPATADRPEGGFGFRLGGKSRLQQRVDRQAKRETSTVRKALTASVTAMAVVGAGTAAVLGYQRLAAEGAAIPGFGLGQDASAEAAAGSAPLAAAAVSPSPLPEALAGEAETAYAEAVARLDAGDAEGVALLSRAANLGHAAAQLRLARLYETGEAGVAADPAEARAWTERAAQRGEPRAMHQIAMYLFEGVGGPADQAAAARWFRAAAERGLGDSQYNLARLYELGAAGLAADPAEAYRWYLIAAREGDAEAEAAARRLRAELPSTQRLRAEADADRFEVAAG